MGSAPFFRMRSCIMVIHAALATFLGKLSDCTCAKVKFMVLVETCRKPKEPKRRPAPDLLYTLVGKECDGFLDP